MKDTSNIVNLGSSLQWSNTLLSPPSAFEVIIDLPRLKKHVKYTLYCICWQDWEILRGYWKSCKHFWNMPIWLFTELL